MDRQPVAFTDLLHSPLGPLRLVVADDGALLRIDLPAHAGDRPGSAIPPRPGEVQDERACRGAAAQLAEYFAGQRREFDLDLRLLGTPFQLAAWQALRQIPFGRTCSYQWQAAAIGNPRAMRAVGAANGKNPIPIVVPCHRVLGKDGSLTGFGGGLPCKRWLLDHERMTLAAAGSPTAH